MSYRKDGTFDYHSLANNSILGHSREMDSSDDISVTSRCNEDV